MNTTILPFASRTATLLLCLLMMAPAAANAQLSTLDSPLAKPYTRWWWLGSAVDEANLTRSLEAYAQKGIGGVEITPIYGVRGNDSASIPFLSPRWMEVYAHAAREAKRLGMEVDMNTDTGWPFGGPHIALEDAAGKAIFRRYTLAGGEKLGEKVAVSNPVGAKPALPLSRLMAFERSAGRKLDLTAKVSADGMFSYITRAQSFLQQGLPDNDFLLYLPIYDIWRNEQKNHYMAFSIHDMRQRTPEFISAVTSIVGSGYDVDYISDRLIKATKVEGGLLKRSLSAMLAALPAADFGGVSVAPFGKGKIVTGADYPQTLAACGVSAEAIRTELGARCIRRANESGHHYFIANLQERDVDAWVSLAVGATSAALYDPMTGKYGKAKVRQSNGKAEVYLQLRSGESAILQTFESADVEAAPWPYYREQPLAIEVARGWQLQFVESEPAIDGTFFIDRIIPVAAMHRPAWTDSAGAARFPDF